MSSERSTICLNMIVRNEAHVIERCLQSVRPFIDSYCIADTGSTDGTQDIIRKVLADIPGEVHDRPWKDFGFNRTEAIQLAKGKADYLLIVDADDVLTGSRPALLTHDEISITVKHGGSTHRRPHLFRSTLPYRYVGVLHEYLQCDIEVASKTHLPSLVYCVGGGGARSSKTAREKFLHDAEVLEKALRAEPSNARYAYYLGQSYKDADEPKKAVEAFERRVGMVGFVEETYLSLEYIAELAEAAAGDARDEATIDQITKAYLRAYGYRPSRLEPLYRLCDYLNRRGKFTLAYLIARGAVGTPISTDIFLVDYAVYEWRMKDAFSIAAFYVNDKKAARQAFEELLASPQVPPAEIPRIKENLRFLGSE